MKHHEFSPDKSTPDEASFHVENQVTELTRERIQKKNFCDLAYQKFLHTLGLKTNLNGHVSIAAELSSLSSYAALTLAERDSRVLPDYTGDEGIR